MDERRWVPPAPGRDAPLILVVEDDPDAQQVASAMLHIIGYRTRLAQDGREALDVLKRTEPVAVLLDRHMPGLDGIGFLDTAIREVPGFSDAIVIATSGVYKDEAALDRPLNRRGVRHFVRKPFSMARLKEGLTEVIEAHPPVSSVREESIPPTFGGLEEKDRPQAPERPAEVLEQAPRVSVSQEQQGGTPTPTVAIPAPPEAGPEHGEERLLTCYFGAAVFFGANVESVAITELSAAGVRLLVDRSNMLVGDAVRVRGHIDIPGRTSEGLLKLTLGARVLWRTEHHGQVHVGLAIEKADPVKGFARLLAQLTRRQRSGDPTR